MNDEVANEVERQIAGVRPTGAPAELRAIVLRDVQRELRAARWDRGLARAAIVLIAAGIGLNFAVNRQWGSKGGGRMDQVAASRNQEALTQTAKAIAEVTDADTGRRLAVRLAAMSGHELSREEEAAINEAVEKRPIHVAPSEKKG